jgi:hypothetical protein
MKLENQEDIRTGITHTGTIESVGEDESGNFRYALVFEDQQFPLNQLEDLLGTFEGWKIDLKIY